MVTLVLIYLVHAVLWTKMHMFISHAQISFTMGIAFSLPQNLSKRYTLDYKEGVLLQVSLSNFFL